MATDFSIEETDALSSFRAGPRSSALVGGYTVEHRDLETQLFTLKETEDALLFPSGFAANQVATPFTFMRQPLLSMCSGGFQ